MASESKQGYWTDFRCPLCNSTQFGSYQNADGTYTRFCHGVGCDYKAHESSDNNHFITFVLNSHPHAKEDQVAVGVGE